jgi:hypothetical protein
MKGIKTAAWAVAGTGIVLVAAVLLQREIRRRAPPPPPAAGAAPAVAPRPVKLLQLRAASPNAMAFIQEAMKHPQSGGYYHLLKAIDDCARHAAARQRTVGDKGLTASPKSDPQLMMRRQRALDEASRFCEGLAPSARTDLDTAQLARDGRRLGDPLLQLAATASDAQDKRPVVQAAMELADPLFLFSEAGSLFTRNAAGKLYFDGQWRDDGLAPLALQLAACDLGYPCDHTLAMLRDRCAFEAECFDAFATVIAEGRSPAALAALNAMRHTLWRAFDKKDVSPFLPPAS